MSAHVYKLIEVVGSSKTSIEDAIRRAVSQASTTVRHIDWLDVVSTRGHVEAGTVIHFQVTVKLGFRMEEDTPEGLDAGGTAP